MIKTKLIALYNGLNQVKNLKGVKFAYGVIKNIRLMENEIVSIQESIKPVKDFMEYDMERMNLAKKHSKKDKNGNPVIENNNFVLESEKEFELEFEALKEKHSSVLSERQKQIELYKIKMSDIPQDISTEQLAGIFDIVENNVY